MGCEINGVGIKDAIKVVQFKRTFGIYGMNDPGKVNLAIYLDWLDLDRPSGFKQLSMLCVAQCIGMVHVDIKFFELVG